MVGFQCRRRVLSRRRAVILVLTLWIVLVLSLMAQSLVFEMRVEMKLTNAYRAQLTAEQLARIGVARAVADLRNDMLFDSVSKKMDNRAANDTLSDYWAAGGQEPLEIEVESKGSRKPEGVYQVMVVDEESKIDLNGMSASWLTVMTNLLQILDVDEDDAKDLAQAIWDWKDGDDLVLGGQEESETTYYSNLAETQTKRSHSEKSASRVFPKNAPFDSVDELLQVPGMTPEIFYGYDPEETPDPPFFPARSYEKHPDRRPGLRDLVTIRARSFNVNTAGYECLSAVCAYATDSLDNGEALAKRIIEFRQGFKYMDSDSEDNALRTERDCEKIRGFTPPLLAKMKQAVRLTMISSYFTIYSEGTTGRTVKKFRTSSTDNAPSRPPTRARIIAECSRSGISPSRRDLESLLPEDLFKRISDSNLDKYYFSDRFYLPAIYFKRWVSY